MNVYSVAVYSAQKCILFDYSDIEKIVFSRPQSQDSSPDPARLESIQKDISFNNMSCNSSLFKDNAKVVIVVPDNWISVSQHRIDHVVPTRLASLAALSYAVETTFSVPESLMFHYQQTLLDEKKTQLTVFACTSEWATQLCSPFQTLGMSCLLLSQTQWSGASVRNRSWSFLRKAALSVYQPDKEKRKRVRRLWLSLMLLSLLIHSGAYFYFLTLQEQAEAAFIDRQKILTFKSDWEADQTSTPFIESTIALVQALPASVRLMQFDADFSQAVLLMTLPQHELIPLIDLWRQGDSSLQFEWEPISYDEFSGLSSKEVMDVSISISKN